MVFSPLKKTTGDDVDSFSVSFFLQLSFVIQIRTCWMIEHHCLQINCWPFQVAALTGGPNRWITITGVKCRGKSIWAVRSSCAKGILDTFWDIFSRTKYGKNRSLLSSTTFFSPNSNCSGYSWEPISFIRLTFNTITKPYGLKHRHDILASEIAKILQGYR